MGMKENDGKGARRVLGRKVAAILVPFFLLIAGISLFRKTKTSDSPHTQLERRKDVHGRHPDRVDELRKEMHHMHDRHEMIEQEDLNEDILDAEIEKLLRKQHLNESEKEKLIVTGNVHLVDVSGHNLERAVGSFCRLNWSAQKKDPSKVPMFRDLIELSPHCAKSKFEFKLKEAIEITKRYDEESNTPDVRILEPNGFVFHESRCGSTLVANSLSAFSPFQTRVYSESTPALKALTSCGEHPGSCSKEQAADFFKNVIYMMGRTNNPDEKYMFFKIQSAGSKFLSVLGVAFPDTPWIFVYRDPVEVMMSHLDIPQMQRAVCLRSTRRPPKMITDMAKSKGKDMKSISPEEFCAMHLATLCQSALDEFHRTDKGEFVNYVDLPNILIDYIIPDHFNIPIDAEEARNIHEVSSVYSKGSHNRDKEWKEDSQTKQEHASEAILKASETWLLPTFKALEDGESKQ